MKKITLFLGLSIVGLVGYAQQSNDTQNISSTNNQIKEYLIEINTSETIDNINQLLLETDSRNALNFETNTHELAHKSSGSVDIEKKFIEGAYSYNEYALNFDFKSNTLDLLNK
jgi:hypothetical protein